MHSPLLSNHFYHVQSSSLTLHIFLFHSAFFLHCPSTASVAFLSILHRILLFSSPNDPTSFSPCVQTTSKHCSARPANSHNTSSPHFSLSPFALLHTYSSDTLFPLHLISSSLILPCFMFQFHVVQWTELILSLYINSRCFTTKHHLHSSKHLSYIIDPRLHLCLFSLPFPNPLLLWRDFWTRDCGPML